MLSKSFSSFYMPYISVCMSLQILFGVLFSVLAHSQNTADDCIKNGIAKAKQQDYKGAIQDFSKEIKLHPDNFKAYMYRAYAKEAMQDYKGAIQDYNEAILFKPDSAGIFYDRALAKYSFGDLKNACLDWKKSVELGLPDARYMLKHYCK